VVHVTEKINGEAHRLVVEMVVMMVEGEQFTNDRNHHSTCGTLSLGIAPPGSIYQDVVQRLNLYQLKIRWSGVGGVLAKLH
jgi:hypothetical protein